MNVFFQASYQERDKFQTFYTAVSEEIARLGYKLTSDENLKISTEQFYQNMKKSDQEKLQNFY